MESQLFAFFIVVFVIWVNTVLAKAVASIWLDSEKSTIAGFAFVLGSTAALRRLELKADDIGMWLGLIVGFASIWWVHFGRNRIRQANG